jgi:hypothetical protein
LWCGDDVVGGGGVWCHHRPGPVDHRFAAVVRRRRRRRRRRMLVWCLCVVVVVWRRIRRMCVVWLRRRMRMTQVGLEGDGCLPSSALPVEGSIASRPPVLHELVYGPGDCCGELLLHFVVCGGGGHCIITCGITFAV